MGFKENCPPELHARGESILTCCKGLPLMIIVVAGILSNMESSKWEEIEKSIKKGNLPTTEECEEIVELSYRHLPDYLKPCFLYFGAYKEDQEVRVRELLWLWIAEGFVKKTEEEHELEDVAKGYMKKLLKRNLIMDAGRGSRGQVKYCVLHDVLLDFCKRKCKQEHFLDSLHGHKLGNFTPLPPRMVYRLCVMAESGDEDYAESTQLFPHLRTLLCHEIWGGREYPHENDILYNFWQSKLLRILALNRIFYFRSFPNEIPQYLGHLKYLALTFVSMGIPPSIGLLSNLETFIIFGGKVIYLPYAVWNMKKLRHMKAFRWKFVWKLDGDNPNLLENLRTLSCIRISDVQEMQELVQKFPIVRRLKCELRFPKYEAETLALDLLSQLESLHIISDDEYLHPFRFRFPENLKKLTLWNLNLPWTEISAIDRLPNLEVLKLMYKSITGETWHVGGEGTAFPKLRSLTLRCLDLEEWTVDSEDSFPCLEMLVLVYCRKLKELPISFLAERATLQLIEISDCFEVADSIKNDIEEMKTDCGNDYLKIKIIS